LRNFVNCPSLLGFQDRSSKWGSYLRRYALHLRAQDAGAGTARHINQELSFTPPCSLWELSNQQPPLVEH